MEDVLDVYARPYDPTQPVVCMDESAKQLLAEVRNSLPTRSASILKVDDEYIRKAVAELFLAVEPLTGKMVCNVETTRTKKDWAVFIKHLVDDVYGNCKQVVLVMDNLNTHNLGSLYEAFEPAQARRIAQRLEIHFTPKHGSWLNVAEIGFSILKRSCIKERVPDITTLRESIRESINSYIKERNQIEKRVNWHFTKDDARSGLKSLYPDIYEFIYVT